MNRRVILLLGFLLLIVAMIFYFSGNENNNSDVMADRFFAVENEEDIHKVILTKRSGSPLVIEREGEDWYVQGERRIRPHLVRNLLTGLTQVSILSQPARSKYPKIEKDFVTFGIKVQIFDEDDDRLRSYYIGSDANDGNGTYYYMEGGERFYLMGLPGFEGSMRARFDIQEAGWWRRQVLDYDPSDISEVKLNYPRQPEESFRIIQESEGQFRVEPLIDRPLITRQFLNERAKAYLQEFRRKGLLTYVNDRPQIDTVLQMTPFAELEVISMDADTQRIVFMPQSSQDIQGPNSQSPYQFFEFRYYVVLPATLDIALAQHLLWRPVFRGYEHFFAG